MTSSQPIQRNYLLDNLKIFLITLVVYGHELGAYIKEQHVIAGIVLAIYSFHMPIFIFVSGYLSKSDSGSNFTKTVANLLIPYIVFSLLWDAKKSLHSGIVNFDITDPPFHLWYLLSLFSWRLLLPVIRSIEYYVIISIGISLLIGLSPLIGQTLSLSRTISLFPFFIFGTICTSSNINVLHRWKYFIPLAAIILAGIIYIGSSTNYLSLGMFTWDQSYHIEGFTRNLFGILFRAGLMVIGCLIGVGVIAAMPARKLFFTNAGSRTLPVYIFHAFLIPSIVVRLGDWNKSLLVETFIMVVPSVLVVLLSLPVVNKAYRIAMNFVTTAVINRPKEMEFKNPI